VHGHGELAGDLAVGAAFEDEVEDGHSAWAGRCEFAVAGAFSFALIPGGFGDFVAEEQAAGEVGDDGVPGAVVGASGGGDLVAESAGEEGGRRREVVEVIAEFARGMRHGTRDKEGGGIAAEEVEEGARGQRVEDSAGWFFAGGAEPAPAAEAHFFIAFGSSLGVEGGVVGFADNGLFEVVGDHVGEELPEGAPELVGALVEGWAGGVEGFPGVDKGNGVAAVFSAEAFDEAFGVEAGPAGAQEGGGGDAKLFADVGDEFAPGVGADRAAIFSEGVGLNGDLVLDRFIRMFRMIQIHRVLGRDDPMHRRDPPVRRADGDAPGADGAGEEGAAAAGEAAGQLLRVFQDFRAELLPGFQNQAIDVVHRHPLFKNQPRLYGIC
jgi:hypothetical protein